MNYNKSYFDKFDDDENVLKNDCINDFIDEKRKSDFSLNLNNSNNSRNNLALFQNKIEELHLKLKFLNSSSNISVNINETSSNDLINNNKIIDIISINDIISKSKTNELNMIDAIDNIIIKLNKKIINNGQIKRKNNIVELEF